MKTTIVILCTLAIIVSLDVAANIFFQKEMRYYEDNISSAVNSIENNDYLSADDLINNINDEWSKNKIIWNMLCDHYEIEQITMLMKTTRTNFDNETYDDVLVDLSELQLLLKFTSLRYSILIDNIV